MLLFQSIASLIKIHFYNHVKVDGWGTVCVRDQVALLHRRRANVAINLNREQGLGSHICMLMYIYIYIRDSDLAPLISR